MHSPTCRTDGAVGHQVFTLMSPPICLPQSKRNVSCRDVLMGQLLGS